MSVIALTDDTGVILERYAYDAYGQPLFLNGSGTVISGSAEGNRYTYTGREWDADLALYHFRARLYDPEAGRFLGRDPLKYDKGGAVLTYGYVQSSPLMYADPLGENPVAIWWMLRIGLAGATTVPYLEWSDTSASFDEIVGNTDTEPVDSTSFSADPSEVDSGPECPSQPERTITLVDLKFTRHWPVNPERRIKINLTWRVRSGSISGHLDSDGTRGAAPGAGFKVIGVTLAASRVNSPCECYKYLPCIDGSVTVRAVDDALWPFSNVDENHTARFSVCADLTYGIRGVKN